MSNIEIWRKEWRTHNGGISGWDILEGDRTLATGLEEVDADRILRDHEIGTKKLKSKAELVKWGELVTWVLIGLLFGYLVIVVQFLRG